MKPVFAITLLLCFKNYNGVLSNLRVKMDNLNQEANTFLEKVYFAGPTFFFFGPHQRYFGPERKFTLSFIGF